METLRLAATGLATHKLRSFLTLLGVIIGVTTVVSVVAIVSGLNHYVASQLVKLSPDVFVLDQFGIITSNEEFLKALHRKKLDDADVEALRRRCAACQEVAVSVRASQTVKRENKKLDDVRINGGTENYGTVSSFDIDTGRFFLDSEDAHSSPVAVLGSDVRDELFGKLDPIGRLIWIEAMPYKVIGTIAKQGSVLGQSRDLQVYIPLGAFRRQFGSRRSLLIFIKPNGGVEGSPLAQDEVRSILRTLRKTPFRDTDPFGIISAGAVEVIWKQISAGAFAFVTFVAGISLAVGGIVIANIMLVAVIERTREIGIRRALGATKRNILLQFLTEAVLLSFCGGLIGLAVGVAIAWLIDAATSFPARITPGIVTAALFIAVVTGFLAGVFPALRAARLRPIDALRYE